MHASHFKCRCCKEEYPLGTKYSCDKCGGLLEICYNSNMLLQKDVFFNPDKRFNGMWKYHQFLPLKSTDNIVTLGEGSTPLIKADRIAQHQKISAKIYIKAEMLNPSGSFKDRPSSLAVSVAKEFGHKAVVVASSGNASAAVAAYAARSGLTAVVFIPKSTDPAKIIQAQAYGAKVFAVDGTFSDAYSMSLKYSLESGYMNCTSTYINPYTIEANKTIAYELVNDLNGKAPDYIIVPIGTGPLLTGVYKGFKELHTMGVINKLPKMVGVQAEQCMPITRAFENKSKTVIAWNNKMNTIAGAIADPLYGYEKDGEETLKTIEECGGCMLSLSESEIAAATEQTEQLIGLYCEPTGATSVGAIKKLFDKKLATNDESFVCLTTGHGFKYTKRNYPAPKIINSLDDITI